MKKETAQALLKLSRDEYDTYASEFSGTRKFFWRELEFLKEYVTPGSKILDIGCGNGRLLDLFEGLDIEYTGIDSSKELIAIAQKERGSRGAFIHADALSLPFEDGTFDVVFSVAMLHHVPDHKNRMQCVSEAQRVLKHGGTCVFTVWNTLQWRFFKQHLVQTGRKLCGLSDLDLGDMIITFGKKKRKRFVHSLSKRALQSLFEKNSFLDTMVREVKRKSGFANFIVTAKK